jgi:hypothetical protein
MLDSGVSPTEEGNGEEGRIRAFAVILVIALILISALGIFRIRQNAEFNAKAPEVGAKAAEASDKPNSKNAAIEWNSGTSDKAESEVIGVSN